MSKKLTTAMNSLINHADGPKRFFLMHPNTLQEVKKEETLFCPGPVYEYKGVTILTVNEFPLDRIELI